MKRLGRTSKSLLGMMIAVMLWALAACSGADTSTLANGSPCGVQGQPCCEGESCDDGLSCVSGRCRAMTSSACGAQDQPCCGGTACNGGLSCGTDTRCHAASSSGDICPRGLSICQGQAPLQCVDGTRWVNLRPEGACPQGTTCVNGDCRVEGCVPGELRCLDGRSFQVCGPDRRWNPAQSCPQHQPYCNMVSNTCTAVPGTCTSSQAGSLRCSNTGDVERCELVAGRYDFVRTEVNCFVEGYAGGCVPLPWSGGPSMPRPLMACRNTCGGQPGPFDDCRLAHEPGTPGSLLCANYVCDRPTWATPTARDRCATYEDRLDCRGPGASCLQDAECAGGRCGPDRQCLAPQ